MLCHFGRGIFRDYYFIILFGNLAIIIQFFRLNYAVLRNKFHSKSYEKFQSRLGWGVSMESRIRHVILRVCLRNCHILEVLFWFICSVWVYSHCFVLSLFFFFCFFEKIVLSHLTLDFILYFFYIFLINNISDLSKEKIVRLVRYRISILSILFRFISHKMISSKCKCTSNFD